MADHNPMLIAVAPNGARRTKADHPALPLTPDELASTARLCLDAGAAMIHLHVRNEQQKHSIAKEHYWPAIKAIRAVVGEQMLIQVTSEAAGIYNRFQQMAAMTELMPAAVSIALRELVPDESAIADAQGFFKRLHDAGTLIQYIIYDTDDLARYHTLCRDGVIPGNRHMLLFVLGRYGSKLAEPADLDVYLNHYKGEASWMCCAFGRNELAIMLRAAQLGGHARVGFENNLQNVDGSLVSGNNTLVHALALNAVSAGRTLASAAEGVALYRRV